MRDRNSILICVTCRMATPQPEILEERPGARLYRALLKVAERRADPIDLVPVECLSVCRRPCTIGFSAPGKWTYIYGDFAPDERAAEAILDAAALYAATADGLIPWKQRPDALKRGVVARLPPFSARGVVDQPEAAE
jgi:predicted metal-binding protein